MSVLDVRHRRAEIKPSCVRTFAFPISSAERQHLLTFSHLIFSFEPGFIASFQGDAVLPEWAERILSWRHTGFHVHSLVRTKTKLEAECVGKYMIRPLLTLERLTFLEPEGKVGYRHGEKGAEREPFLSIL